MDSQPNADDYLEACEAKAAASSCSSFCTGSATSWIGGTASRLIFDEFNAMTTRGLSTKTTAFANDKWGYLLYDDTVETHAHMPHTTQCTYCMIPSWDQTSSSVSTGPLPARSERHAGPDSINVSGLQSSK